MSAGTGRGTHAVAGPYKGLFANRTAIAIEAIQDGSSNTLAYGESVGPWPTDPVAQPNQFARTWMGASPAHTTWGIPSNPKTALMIPFSSYHSGVCLFAMGDGAVRYIRPGVPSGQLTDPSWLTFQRMAGYQDGQVPDNSSADSFYVTLVRTTKVVRTVVRTTLRFVKGKPEDEEGHCGLDGCLRGRGSRLWWTPSPFPLRKDAPNKVEAGKKGKTIGMSVDDK